MSTHTAQPPRASRQRTRSCATGLRCHRCDHSYALEDTIFSCPDCGKGLDVVYDYELAASSLPRLPHLRAAPQHLALRGAAADRRRRSPGAGRPALRLHAADQGRPARSRAGHRQPLPEGRLLELRPSLSYKDRVVAMSVAQAAGARQGRDRLRVHRQRRHGRRLAGRQGRRGLIRLLPQPARGHEGPGLHGAGGEGRPGRGQLRRSQPALPGSGGSHRHGLRQHHAAPVLRRGRQDGLVRDRRAARLAGARAHHHRAPRAAPSPRACTRGCWSCSCSSSPRPTARASTSPSRAGATRSPARSSPRKPRSTR